MAPEPDRKPALESLDELIRAARAKGVFLALYLRTAGGYLDVLRVRDDLRNQGIGTWVMQEVSGWADRFRLSVSLCADDRYGPTDKHRLLQFYRRFGFRRVRRGTRGEMRRQPRHLRAAQGRLAAAEHHGDGEASLSFEGITSPIS